jgi:hypothetical protein
MCFQQGHKKNLQNAKVSEASNQGNNKSTISGRLFPTLGGALSHPGDRAPPTLATEIDRPSLPFPYVVYVCLVFQTF